MLKKNVLNGKDGKKVVLIGGKVRFRRWRIIAGRVDSVITIIIY